jgi:hypothetical protein
MKKIITFLVAAMFVLNVTSQTAKSISKDIIITPGVGIDKLVLGMTPAAAAKFLGGDISWFTYEGEMRSWTSSENMSIDSIPQFVIGFDSCLKYQNKLSDKLPIYSLYFKNQKLVYINITSYGATPSMLRNVKLKNGLKFNDAESKCISKLGKNFMKITYEEYDDHVYYTTGIEVSYSENKLVTIGIFPASKNYPQMLAENSKRLLKEFEESKAE